MQESGAPSQAPRIDADLVTRLVRQQFPEWAHLPVRSVEAQGWDNRTFRLGSGLTARLPTAIGYEPQVAKEQRWLPHLAAQLQVPVPVPQARGVPGEGYPFAWSVLGWLDGEPALQQPLQMPVDVARSLAAFLTDLHRVDATDGPPPGPDGGWRGGPLSTYEEQTRHCIDLLGEVIDRETATAVWEAALASVWDRPAVWFHGDMAAGNLLISNDSLAAVIDFGCCGVGDPACDLAIAWTLFSGESRTAFREGLRTDDATWARGRGWALWKALITVAEDRADDSRGVAEALRVANAIFEEFRSSARD